MAINKHTSILDDNKMSLFGERGEKGAPRMFFSVSDNGNPSCMVFPNDPKDTERKPIRGAMDPVIWTNFVELCLMVFNQEEPIEHRLDLRAGKPSSTFTDAVMIVGKDSEGICYLGLVKKDRAKKRFSLLPGVYTDFVNKDGTPMPNNVKSRIFANAYIKTLDYHVSRLVHAKYKPYVKEEDRSPSQTPSDTSGLDDDIPF